MSLQIFATKLESDEKSKAVTMMRRALDEQRDLTLRLTSEQVRYFWITCNYTNVYDTKIISTLDIRSSNYYVVRPIPEIWLRKIMYLLVWKTLNLLDDNAFQEKDAQQRLANQKTEYETTIQRHLGFIDQLIADKKDLSDKVYNPNYSVDLHTC